MMELIDRGANDFGSMEPLPNMPKQGDDDLQIGQHVAVDLKRLTPDQGGGPPDDVGPNAILTTHRPNFKSNVGRVTRLLPGGGCSVSLVCTCAAGEGEYADRSNPEAFIGLGGDGCCGPCAPCGAGTEVPMIHTTQRQIVCSTCLHVNLPMALPQIYCSGCSRQIKNGQKFHKERGANMNVKLCTHCFQDLSCGTVPELLHDYDLDPHGFETDTWNAKENVDYDGFVQCEGACKRWYHYVCALFPDVARLPNEWGLEAQIFVCKECRRRADPALKDSLRLVALHDRRAAALRRHPLSDAIEEFLAKKMRKNGIILNGFVVRVVSSRRYTFPALPLMKQRYPDYPDDFPYDSRVLIAFQEIDGRDVCVFAMYVQEYGPSCPQPNTNRTYISYLDSVRMITTNPPNQRKPVHHAIINGYLANARDRGFEHAHIWVAPPQPGDEYIFHCHPPDKVHGNRTMSMQKLREWYITLLDYAQADGIVSSYDDIQNEVSHLTSIREFPLFEGDFFPDHVKTMLAPPAQPAAGPPTLMRESSHALANSLKKKTHSMRKRFLVAKLTSTPGSGTHGAAAAADAAAVGWDYELSDGLVDKRMDFLELCKERHWQFNEVRRAHYSSMMVLAALGGCPD